MTGRQMPPRPATVLIVAFDSERRQRARTHPVGVAFARLGDVDDFSGDDLLHDVGLTLVVQRLAAPLSYALPISLVTSGPNDVSRRNGTMVADAARFPVNRAAEQWKRQT